MPTMAAVGLGQHRDARSTSGLLIHPRRASHLSAAHAGSRSVLIVRPPRRRDRPVDQGLRYVNAARRHAHLSTQMIFASCAMRILRDRELKEGQHAVSRATRSLFWRETLRFRHVNSTRWGSILRGGRPGSERARQSISEGLSWAGSVQKSSTVHAFIGLPLSPSRLDSRLTQYLGTGCKQCFLGSLARSRRSRACGRRHVERCLTKSKDRAIQADTFRDMDPVRNPYAPGAGQRPPELAGRDAELTSFDVALERVERGRPERSLVLTGLRGVGKTVLLNALRSKALDRGWGTGKVEARPDTACAGRSLERCTQPCASCRTAPCPDRVREVLATLKAFDCAPTRAAGSSSSADASDRRAAEHRPRRFR